MPFKYQAELAAVSSLLTEAYCPCLAATVRDCIAYRLSYNPQPHPDDYLPRPLDANPPPPRTISIPPHATLAQILEQEHAICNQWAISLFENPYAARKIRHKYRRGLQQEYIAKLRVTPTDGECTPIDHKKHFNLHEFVGVRLHHNVLQTFPI